MEPIDKDKLLEILNFRHACKLFDNTKKIPKDDMDFILESGRLAPSSFGMEHWRFVAIRNDELRSQLEPFCWNQPQICSCDTLVAIITKPKEVTTKEYYTYAFSRRNLSPEMTEAYVGKYEGFVESLESVNAWCEKQCYIAASNMMNYAACIGVDSCPIEGFEKAGIENLLEIQDSEGVALLIAFGHRLNTATPKVRLESEDIISWME